MVAAPRIEFSPFALDGVARHRRGWERPISIRLEAPASNRPGEYVCPVYCSLVSEKVHPIRAVEPEHAYSLAFRFLRIVLSDFALFASDGSSFTLPRVPPWDDDWIRPDVLPERGLKMRANAVGPEGELGMFPVAVSPPRPDSDGYAADVEFGIKDQIAAIVHAKTLHEAFYAGIDWIAGRLEAGKITLLDLWNEPNELPKRPVPNC